MLKTLSFAAVHFTVAFTIGYLLTGSVLVGGTLAGSPAAKHVDPGDCRSRID